MSAGLVCVLTDRWFEYPGSPDNHSEYEIHRDGQPTGYRLFRVGRDLPELEGPDGQREYLTAPDLRGGKPEALRIVAARMPGGPECGR